MPTATVNRLLVVLTEKKKDLLPVNPGPAFANSVDQNQLASAEAATYLYRQCL